MADFTALKTAIQNAIKQNGNEEITGNLLQEVLLAIVTTLGDGSINDLITALDSEATTRSQADGTLQQNINAEQSARQLADSTLQSGINNERDLRIAADNAMQSAITAISNHLNEGYIYVGIATTSTNPSTPSGKVFYIAVVAGTYTNFLNSSSQPLVLIQGINILKYNGTSWSVEQIWGVDDNPTAGSNKLVKSGGVFNDIMTNGSAFDLSAYNNGTTYAELNAALTALNALPADYKKGGMSLKFVRTSDNKYVQARCMAQNFTTDVTQWQGVDDEPTDGSNNFVKSGGIWQDINLQNITGGRLDHFSIVEDNNYYTTPFIHFGGGNCVWNTSEINNDAWIAFYNSSYTQINQNKADNAVVTRTNSGDTYAFIRCCFRKNNLGSLIVNGNKVWDNTTIDLNSLNNIIDAKKQLNSIDNKIALSGSENGILNNSIIAYDTEWYTTPMIEYGGGSLIWNTSEVNNNSFIVIYKSDLTIKSFSRGNQAQITRTDAVSADFAYVRVCFKKNNVGNLIINSKVVWDNTTIDVNLYNVELDRNAFVNLIKNYPYQFMGIALSLTNPGVPKFKQWYLSISANTYTNFIDKNGNAITTDSKRIYILQTYTKADGTLCWEKVDANIPNSYYLDLTLESGMTYKGIAVPDLSPVNYSYSPCYYLTYTGGTYTNFLDSNGNPIVVRNGILTLLRTFRTGGSFQYWIKDEIGVLTKDIFSSTNQCLGVATPSTVPETPKDDTFNVFYFATTSGTYTNFGNITVNSGEIAILRSYMSGNVFAGWLKDVIGYISVDQQAIQDAVNAYFEEHPSSANQYVEFTTGSGSSAIIGPNQDGAESQQCVAVGISNMTNNTGTKNVTVGKENMQDTTGNRNTSMGYHSLFRNTSGEDNSAFGAESQDDTTTGKENTSIGAYSLQRNRLGDGNTVVGAYALKGTDGTGSQGTAPDRTNIGNTVIGHEALKNAHDGCNRNIVIGKQAMKENGILSDNVIIGNGVEPTREHQMILGDSGIQDVILCGNKRIIFNNDGTVTWETVNMYKVTYNFSKTSRVNPAPVAEGGLTYSTVINVVDGYTLDAEGAVTIVKVGTLDGTGGIDVTSTAWDATTKTVSISNVTGNIWISMRAVAVS